jgi:hypothetical protein
MLDRRLDVAEVVLLGLKERLCEMLAEQDFSQCEANAECAARLMKITIDIFKKPSHSRKRLSN